MDHFHCCAISCARQLKTGRTRHSYLIEESCRHSQSGACTYRRSYVEVKRPEPQAQESIRTA